MRELVKLMLAFLTHELRTQGRSLRFRLLATILVAGSLALPLLIAWRVVTVGAGDTGPATFAAATCLLLPLLSGLLAFVLGLDAVSREREEGSLVVVGLAALSNAGYLLRKWLSVSLIVACLSLVPLLVAMALALGILHQPPTLAPLALPWLMRVVPMTFALSALGLGLGTITGGLLPSLFLLGTLLFLIHGKLDGYIARVGHHWSSPLAWLTADSGSSLPWLFMQVRRGTSSPLVLEVPATEAPWDALEYAKCTLPISLTTLGLAALLLGASVAYVRRASPDVRPWRIRPDHPLRTFLAWLNSWRESLVPDPGLGVLDRLAILALLATSVACYGASCVLGLHWARIGLTQATMEQEGEPEPTDAGLVPTRWRLSGTLDASGSVDLRVEAGFRNEGLSAASHVACTLDRHLRLDAEGVVQLVRKGDRVAFELPSPLAPGNTMALRFHVTGIPAEDALSLPSVGSALGTWMATHEQSTSGTLPDLSSSASMRAFSTRRVRLLASHLSPVPRFTTWKVPPASERQRERKFVVPEEMAFPEAEVEWDLTVPGDVFVTNSCGDVAKDGRLVGSCTVPISSLAILGGSLELVQAGGTGGIAVLPGHVAIARRALQEVAQSFETAQRAWPELQLPPPALIVEMPAPMSGDPWADMAVPYWWWSSGPVRPAAPLGRLATLSEGGLLGTDMRQAVAGSRFAAASVVAAFTKLRPIAPEQDSLFYDLYSILALGPVTSSAVVDKWSSEAPLVGGDPQLSWQREYKLPAVLADVQNRVGSAHLREAIVEFAGAGSQAGPGTIEELLKRAGTLAGVSLDNCHRDFVAGHALPRLTLDGVTFKKVESGWRVDGTVLNDGDGEAWCEVILRTDVETTSAKLAIPGQISTPFHFHVTQHPRTVLLDPEGRCYRLSMLGRVARVENKEGT